MTKTAYPLAIYNIAAHFSATKGKFSWRLRYNLIKEGWNTYIFKDTLFKITKYLSRSVSHLPGTCFSFLAQLFGEYESYIVLTSAWASHLGKGFVCTYVSPYLSYNLKYCIETFYNASQLRNICKHSSWITLILHILQIIALSDSG